MCPCHDPAHWEQSSQDTALFSLFPATCVEFLLAARGGRRPAGAARHVHVQGARERAPQRPHPPRQPHGRQAQAQPARQQSHQGPRPLAPITAGAAARSGRRRHLRSPPPGPEPSRPTCPSSPCRAEAGVGRGGRRAAFPPPLSFPPAERRQRRRGFPPGARTSGGGARSRRGALPSTQSAGRAGRETGPRERAFAWRARPSVSSAPSSA